MGQLRTLDASSDSFRCDLDGFGVNGAGFAGVGGAAKGAGG